MAHVPFRTAAMPNPLPAPPRPYPVPVAPQVGRRAPDGLPPMVAVRLLVRLPQQALHLMGIQAVQSPPHRLPTLRVPSQRLAQLLVHVVAVQHEDALGHVLTALPDPPRPVASHEDGRHMLQVVMPVQIAPRSEEHTSELQSRPHLVCRLLLEKKKKKNKLYYRTYQSIMS